MPSPWLIKGEIRPRANEGLIVDLTDEWVFPSIWHGNAGNPGVSVTTDYAGTATGTATNAATIELVPTAGTTTNYAATTTGTSTAVGDATAFARTRNTASVSHAGTSTATSTSFGHLRAYASTGFAATSTAANTTFEHTAAAPAWTATAAGTSTATAATPLDRTRNTASTGHAGTSTATAATPFARTRNTASTAHAGTSTAAVTAFGHLRSYTPATATGTSTAGATGFQEIIAGTTLAGTAAGTATTTATGFSRIAAPAGLYGNTDGTSTATSTTFASTFALAGRATGTSGHTNTGLANASLPATTYGPGITPAVTARRPANLMAIGPANGGYRWRGAPNYGLAPYTEIVYPPITETDPKIRDAILRNRERERLRRLRALAIGKSEGLILPSRPTIALPPAQSTSYTLRLDGPSEARTEHIMGRTEAIVIEEMMTDLWWRRRSPTGEVEDVGRFNADTVEVSKSDNDQVKLAAAWTDYRGLLEERLVLEYLDPVNSESMWAKGTSVIHILRFVIPTNIGMDLSVLHVDNNALLGTITEHFELPPGTSVADAMRNLEAISTLSWDWWAEMPDTDTAQPKLAFAVGQRLVHTMVYTGEPHQKDPTGGRGTDRGVILIDIGHGETPIESWSVQAASASYANTLFFSGAEGGVVVRFGADVEQFGQRDATDSDSSITAKNITKQQNVDLIYRAGQRRLRELADRTPTWQINLRSGFWQGRSHIDIGDWVTVYIEMGSERVAGKHRVTEITVDIDASGTERVALTLGKPRPSRDPRSRHSAIARLVRKLKRYERKGP